MSFLKKTESLEFIASISFMAFLFLMTIFTGVGKVNNLFHLSITTMMIFLFFQRKKLSLPEPYPWRSIGVIALFLIYYSITNLWTSVPENIISTLKHTVYLLFFVCMFDYCIKRYGLL